MHTLRKRRVFWEMTLAIALVALLLAPIGANAHPAGPAGSRESQQAVAFNQQMRKLWEDHIVWTRMVIVSFAAGLPDSDPAVSRLLQNQADIGDAIRPFYGDAAGDQLTALLRDHILIAADLLKAAKAGDTDAFDGARARWYANAGDIAAFLNAANPRNWPLEDLQTMMRSHLDLKL